MKKLGAAARRASAVRCGNRVGGRQMHIASITTSLVTQSHISPKSLSASNQRNKQIKKNNTINREVCCLNHRKTKAVSLLFTLTILYLFRRFFLPHFSPLFCDAEIQVSNGALLRTPALLTWPGRMTGVCVCLCMCTFVRSSILKLSWGPAYQMGVK